MPMAKEKTRITIYDVASRANVAISTVSRVLNQSPEVSPATRNRVERAISELQYRPDRTARSLAQQEYNTLAVALPSFTAPFQNELLKGIRTCIGEHALDLLICDLGSSNHDRALLDFLKRGAVQGMLIGGMQISPTVRKALQTLQAPTSVIGTLCEGVDSYTWDDTAGASMAVGHLIEQGHKHIAMIRSATTSILQEARADGYRNALLRADLPLNEELILAGRIEKHGGFSEEDGYDAMSQLLERFPEVTAVFASSDVQAIGALSALADKGRRVPDDVAVVGYDDIKTSRFIGLSSVSQYMQQTALEATRRLLARIDGAETAPVIQRTMTPELHIRHSSDRQL